MTGAIDENVNRAKELVFNLEKIFNDFAQTGWDMRKWSWDNLSISFRKEELGREIQPGEVVEASRGEIILGTRVRLYTRGIDVEVDIEKQEIFITASAANGTQSHGKVMPIIKLPADSLPEIVSYYLELSKRIALSIKETDFLSGEERYSNAKKQRFLIFGMQ